jgi:hypothetical protein
MNRSTQLSAQRSSLSEEQQLELEQLRDDFAAIRSDSEVTPEQLEAFKSNVQTLLTDDTVSLDNWQDYFTQVAEYIDGGLTEAEMAELTELTSNQFGLDPETDQAAIDAIITDVQAIVEASNWGTADVQMVIDEAQVIGEELREDITTGLAERDISLPEMDEVDNGMEEADTLLGRRGNSQLNGNGRGELLGGFDSDILTGDNGANQLQRGAGRDLLLGGEGNDPLTGLASITQGHGGIDLFNGENATALSDSDGVTFGQGSLESALMENFNSANGDLMELNHSFTHPLAAIALNNMTDTGIYTEAEDSPGLIGMIQTLGGVELNLTEDGILI